MCGIVGALGNKNIVKEVLHGLKTLEYRGYDSAGIAIYNKKISIIKDKGRVVNLEKKLLKKTIESKFAFAHTRWATHGVPSKKNAHPHQVGDITIVHNGIIENFEEIKNKFKLEKFYLSDTDSEVIGHLINFYFKKSSNFLDAFILSLKELKGSYAIAAFCEKEPDKVLVSSLNAPLILAKNNANIYFSSDISALLKFCNQFTYLKNKDIGVLNLNSFTLMNHKKKILKRDTFSTNLSYEDTSLGNYEHYMLKEIFEQPSSVDNTIKSLINKNKILSSAFGEDSNEIFNNINHISIIGCGTSYHAGLVSKFWFQEYTNLTCDVNVASEFIVDKKIKKTLFVAISQSGETADTLLAIRNIKKLNLGNTLCITNRETSTLQRLTDLSFHTKAGIEIGVASTKAFTTQLISLYALAMSIGKTKKLINISSEKKLTKAILSIPKKIKAILANSNKINALTKHLNDHSAVIYIARNILYPIALEGSLKMKEISYLFAHSYPSGELKHGPLALISKGFPVICLIANNEFKNKILSNVKEVESRGANVIIFTNDKKIFNQNKKNTFFIDVEYSNLVPILFNIPLQLFAYYYAKSIGTDIDKPRNLAKSVTVE
jgi:glucosamine--fructose-6-phosphate aminotransferase (isomerizing)